MNSLIRKLFALTAIFLVISHESDAKRLKRYQGGRPAHPGKYKWAVSICFNDHHRKHNCGGSIIDADYVLTAAHCVKHVLPSQLIVRSGSVDLANAISTGVSEIIEHPNYKSTTENIEVGRNDIAILKLEKSLELGGTMAAIRLPRKDRKDVNATFVGWGTLREEPHLIISPRLQVAKVMVISDRKCKEWSRRDMWPYYICGYDSTGAALKGDSGSSLTYRNEIIGIVATGPGVIGVPSYFTNVNHYVDWIKKTIDTANEV